ncbi:hypothetical protein CLV88_102471 [Shimia abyssi]|uniref:DUF1285 domain-containing protein n=2 Tax=Shimia abyssi TaxID=1662395 RepID=A0A2P8FI11_9RHOB|nr:hypothetical protein CLV88_102471 [Shimia abyssi]
MAKAMSGQIPVKPDAEGLAASALAAQKGKGPAPVHLWNPPFNGDIDMRIARDGTWFYQNSPINREALVRLFASILRKDEDRYVLVTPVEMVGITVEDAPFVAINFEIKNAGLNQELEFETNVGDFATAGPENPIRVALDPQTGEPSPYVMIRAGLEARIDRKSFYRLIELGETQPLDGTDWFGIHSGGVFFPIISSQSLEI